jgi:hypothetical protein
MGERRCSSRHFKMWPCVEVSSQLDAPAALPPRKEILVCVACCGLLHGTRHVTPSPIVSLKFQFLGFFFESSYWRVRGECRLTFVLIEVRNNTKINLALLPCGIFKLNYTICKQHYRFSKTTTPSGISVQLRCSDGLRKKLDFICK